MPPWTFRGRSVVAPGVALLAALALASPAGAQGAPGPAADPTATAGSGLKAASGWYRFGTPARVVSRVEIAEDNVTMVTLSNGVRLVLKPTKLVADEVLVNVAVDGGHQSLAPGNRAAAELAESMFVRAGVGLKTHEQLVATFGPAASSIEFDVWTPLFNLGAKAKSAELRPLLEILTAYVSDPGWRFDGLQAAKAEAIENRNLVKSNPTIALQAQSPGLLTSYDPRYMRPTEAQIMAVDEAAARRSIEDQLKSGAIEITVVGDFDLEAAISMVAATFGSLPARSDAAAYQSPPRFPPHTTTPMEIFFSGAPDQQGRLVAWPAPLGLFKSKEEQVISAMLGVMIYRLRDLPAYKAALFRKGLNAHGGYLSISAVGRPETLGSFDADVAKVARDIAARGVTQAEIDRAQAGILGDVGKMKSEVPNRYWLVELMNLGGDRKNWDMAKAFPTYVEGVTPAEVKRAAVQYLKADTSASIVANPEAKPQSR